MTSYEERLMKVFSDIIRSAKKLPGDATCEMFGAMVANVAKLEKRIAELETKQIKYCGVFDAGATYAEGSLVTHKGSVWHADRSTQPGERPGDGAAWTLAVKRGRDAPGVRP